MLGSPTYNWGYTKSYKKGLLGFFLCNCIPWNWDGGCNEYTESRKFITCITGCKVVAKKRVVWVMFLHLMVSLNLDNLATVSHIFCNSNSDMGNTSHVKLRGENQIQSKPPRKCLIKVTKKLIVSLWFVVCPISIQPSLLSGEYIKQK